MYKFGCPYAKDPNSTRAGTGGPAPNKAFTACNGQACRRNADGCIPDEIGKPEQRISNLAGTLSMANTGEPESGGSQFFINVSGT
jgi:cyclophilin family peptidyl-prolyl cis-trans isomerase